MIYLKRLSGGNTDTRSRKLYYNIVSSFGLRFVNVIIGFVLIPLLINTLTNYQYGIWIAIANIVNWINFFDIGLGNGLKNKLGEALAKNDLNLGREYVTTTYIILFFISIIIYIAYIISLNFVNYYDLLNIEVNNVLNLNAIINIIVVGTLLNFLTKLIDNIFLAKQNTAISTLKLTLSQLLILLYVYVISYMKNVDVLLIAIIGLVFIPVLLNFVFSWYYFGHSLRDIRPNIHSFKLKHFKTLFGLGASFFIIQIGVLVMFQTQTFILLKLLGAESVAQYNIAYKFYTILYTVLSIIMTPFWSAIIEAYHKNDFVWIRKKIKDIFVIYLVLGVVISCVLLFFDNALLHIWLKKEFYIDVNLKYSIIIYSIILSLLTIAMSVINGIGKLRIQLYLYVFASIINLPLSYYLTQKTGISGVVISSIVLFLFMNVFLWIQVNLIVKNKSYGIWNK